jgi:TrmH family RNA methyltransferase
MISKARLKYLKSLQIKKYRQAEQCFLVEGRKSVAELLNSSFDVVWLAAQEEVLDEWTRERKRLPDEVVTATDKQLALAGSYQTNDGAIAVARMRPDVIPVAAELITLVLDDIRDPGNLGTLIRTADWYGISRVVASHTTADFYNPKTIQASMGSFTRVHVHYTELATFLASQNKPVYGTFLDGADVHEISVVTPCLVVIGNEANGISEAVARRVSHRVTIPRYGRAESLNAAIAAAVVLDNLKRLQ